MKKVKNVNQLILSWGESTSSGNLRDLSTNKDKYLAGTFPTVDHLIADCGHLYVYPGKDVNGNDMMLPEKVITVGGIDILLKYRTLGGKPTHCHDCAGDLVKELVLAAENAELLFSTIGRWFAIKKIRRNSADFFSTKKICISMQFFRN